MGAEHSSTGSVGTAHQEVSRLTVQTEFGFDIELHRRILSSLHPERMMLFVLDLQQEGTPHVARHVQAPT